MLDCPNRRNIHATKIVALDIISAWKNTNNMKLNPKKCREIIISLPRKIEQPSTPLVNCLMIQDLHISKRRLVWDAFDYRHLREDQLETLPGPLFPVLL